MGTVLVTSNAVESPLGKCWRFDPRFGRSPRGGRGELLQRNLLAVVARQRLRQSRFGMRGEVLLVVLDNYGGMRGHGRRALRTGDFDLNQLAGEVGDEGTLRELLAAEAFAVVRVGGVLVGELVVGGSEALQELEFVEEARYDRGHVLKTSVRFRYRLKWGPQN